MPGWLNRFKKNPSDAQAPALKTTLVNNKPEEKEKRCPGCGEVHEIGYGYTNINVYCEKCKEKNIKEWKEKHSPKLIT